MLTVTTYNVNGVRAAHRRGLGPWLAARRSGAQDAPQGPPMDVLCLQEVRADDATLRSVLADAGWPDAHVAHAEPTDPGTKGRAGVAVVSSLPLTAVRDAGAAGLGERFAGAGRWVEADVEVPGTGTVTVVSAYVHAGGVGTPRQGDKMAFLDAVGARMAALAAPAGALALVTGDVNVCHGEADLRNWRGNRGKAGFLPEERAHLDAWARQGWVDVVRSRHPGEDGPYSWWSWRGKAFDADSGWRIDLQLATPALARLAVEDAVDRAPTWAERVSDHAPVVVRYAAPER